MDLPRITFRDLENHYLKSGSYEVADEDLKSLKNLKNSTQTANFIGFAWVGAFVLADIRFNSKNFSNLKAWYYLGARLPFIGFHCFNAFLTYTVAEKFTKSYFENYIDIIAKYDKDARILKYRKSLVMSSRI